MAKSRDSRIVGKPRSYSDRIVDTRESLPKFLIICEGEKTEPNYFKAFRIPTLSVEDIRVIGLGDNTISLVEKAKEIKEKYNPDYIWCVFDRDSFPPDDFNSAIISAYNNGMYVAYSNEAFELWYLLHFNYYDAAMSRKSYEERLNKLLKHQYKKNSLTMYQELQDKQPTAIKRATKLLRQYEPNRPEKDNPSTTVYLLVQCLNALVEFRREGSLSNKMEKLVKDLSEYHLEAKKRSGIVNPLD